MTTRLVQVTERAPAPDTGRRALGLAGCLVLAYAGLLVTALVPTAAGLLVTALAVAALEVAGTLRAPFVGWALGRIGLGAQWRGLLRAVAVLAFLVRSEAPRSWFLVAVAGLLALAALRAAGAGLAELVHRARRMPVLSRGLDLGRLRVPRALPPVLGRHADTTLGCPDVALSAGAALAVLAGSEGPLVAGAVVAAVLVLAGVAALAYAAAAMRRLSRARLRAAVDKGVAKAAPEVAVHFGSGPDTLYQLEMWVETLERLEVSVLLILRDRETFRHLGPTTLPVLCVEHGTVLMELPLPHLRVALYVSHAVSNLHLLRRRGVRHVFIGHGDSDKPVTTNPFLKAYDEVWVSGPAARERFAAAGIGVDPARVVEIGRPQLDEVAGRGDVGGADRVPGRLTVLYAPTWEGYGDEPNQTSLGAGGRELLERLLAEPDVRVLYRPHPLAGTRDPAVARAHREIVTLLGDRRVRRPASPARLAVPRDDLDVVTAPAGTSRVEEVTAQAAWAGAQLADRPGPPVHLVVPGPDFNLYACFAAADVLVCDVSSVITDFLAGERPYAVTNPAGLPDEEFTFRYPSCRGGYLLGADGAGLDRLLAAGRGQVDPAATERAKLRAELLGPPEPPALERMRKAVAGS
ncbi:hypothetical protein ACWDWO_05345 [Actinopolymorpha singaporensis]|uniref:CDP-Glycerol:Poly(Glycerophosphate) glycerophosphotransferase n=1 Tax=Actinopolymorpha singaporensis TaxID=117157 RepID=A0A1H1XRN1_9ACTN|nr:hypothetical protein [Actinopolymorpha singaporensis]SDT11870.1 hypothetical protein SAMN04489717_5102 [Actinopolymorpha singaporensis]